MSLAAAVLGAAQPVDLPGWRLHPESDLVLLVAGCTWWWARGRLAPRLAPDPANPMTRREVVCFWSGLLLLWVGASWPIHDLGEDHLYWVHMVQHELFTYLAPPLLLLGLPPWLLRWLADLPVLRHVCRTGARPMVALVTFNLVSGIAHVKGLVNAATSSAPMHFGVHLLLFTSAMCFWFPIVNAVPRLPRLKPGAKVLYLGAMSFLPILPVAFLGLAAKPIYRHYEEAPRVRGLLTLSPLDDQQLAAGVMWVVSSFWIIGAITIVFFRWWSSEQRAGGTNHSLPEHIRRRPVAVAER